MVRISRCFSKISCFCLLLVFQQQLLHSQDLNYAEIFGSDWIKAESFLNDNRQWMDSILDRHHISYPLAVAVIFPELVRYSALRDKMETTLLKALYINLGEAYANFSIGQFQMKPSFADVIRRESDEFMSRRSGIRFRQAVEYDDIYDYRRSIVSDLEDTKMEFIYLIAFIRICEKKYRTDRMDEAGKLKFLATAYNFGINRSRAEIEQMYDRKFFNTKLFKTENYSYAAVSRFWYNGYISSGRESKK